MKIDLFQSCEHCWVFQLCWHMECNTFTAWYFRIWNSSTGISSPPLALFVVMLKVHLTSHSRMSGSIPGCLALGEWSHHHDYLGHEGLFCSVLLCILAISSWYLLLLLGPYYFCPLLSPSTWNVPLVSLIFLKRSLVFPILLFSSTSLHWSPRKAFLSLLVILRNSAFKWVYLSFFLAFHFLLFTAICKASPDSRFAFLHFFFLAMVLIPVSCTVSRTSVHSSSSTLSIRSTPLKSISHFHCIIVKDLI